ncbi:MAG: hypothetical protein ACT4P9_03940 [Betaproteobacteria bacterium]
MSGKLLRSAVAILALGACAGAALAQLRTIPTDAKRGTLTHVGQSEVRLDGKTARLSPGAQIRDANNRIVLPTMLPPDSKVKYLPDALGNLHRIWILSEQEIAQPDPAK